MKPHFPAKSPYSRRKTSAADCWVHTDPVKPRSPWHGLTPEEAYRKGKEDARKEELRRRIEKAIE